MSVSQSNHKLPQFAFIIILPRYLIKTFHFEVLMLMLHNGSVRTTPWRTIIILT